MGIHQIPPATSRKNQTNPQTYKKEEYELFLRLLISYTKFPIIPSISLSLSLSLQIRIFDLYLHSFSPVGKTSCRIVWSDPEATTDNSNRNRLGNPNER